MSRRNEVAATLPVGSNVIPDDAVLNPEPDQRQYPVATLAAVWYRGDPSPTRPGAFTVAQSAAGRQWPQL